MNELKTQLIAVCDEALAGDVYTPEEKEKIARLRAWIIINL